jgi:chemotaxis protein methyltransferase CheR
VSAVEPALLGALSARVREAGFAFTGARGELLAGALERAAAAGGEPPGSLARRLVAGDAPLQPLLEELAVAETWFFRDLRQWELVEREVLPPLRARGGRLRAWSAGCATGEEPYTLAMVLLESGLADRAEVLASDLSSAALARARRGDYSLWSLRGQGQARARRWLREEDGRFAVVEPVRRPVTFFQHDLLGGGWPPGEWRLEDLDLVLCRNVLIYLGAPQVRDVAGRLFQALAPGGWLLAGAADPPLGRLAPFEVRSGPFGVAYVRPARGRAEPGGPGTPAPRRAAPAGSGAVRLPRPREAARKVKSRAAAVPDRDCSGCRALLDAGRLAEARVLVDEALRHDPLRAELHLLRALLLTELGRLGEAEEACRRAVYLDRRHPFLHFFLAVLRLQRGDAPAAARGLRAALALCAGRDPDEVVTLSDGMTVGGLAAAARSHLERAEGAGRGRP